MRRVGRQHLARQRAPARQARHRVNGGDVEQAVIGAGLRQQGDPGREPAAVGHQQVAGPQALDAPRTGLVQETEHQVHARRAQVLHGRQRVGAPADPRLEGRARGGHQSGVETDPGHHHAGVLVAECGPSPLMRPAGRPLDRAHGPGRLSRQLPGVGRVGRVGRCGRGVRRGCCGSVRQGCGVCPPAGVVWRRRVGEGAGIGPGLGAYPGQVSGKVDAVGHHSGCSPGIPDRHPEVAGCQVRRAQRDDAHLGAGAGQAGRHRAHRSVTAGGHHQARPGRQGQACLHRAGLGDARLQPHGPGIAGLVQLVLQQGAHRGGGARLGGVDDDAGQWPPGARRRPGAAVGAARHRGRLVARAARVTVRGALSRRREPSVRRRRGQPRRTG